MLRALRFMDSMIQRDIMQKAAFLNDLTTFWHKFDDRVLRLKVYSLSAMRGVSVPRSTQSLSVQRHVCMQIQASYQVCFVVCTCARNVAYMSAVAMFCCSESEACRVPALHVCHCYNGRLSCLPLCNIKLAGY